MKPLTDDQRNDLIATLEGSSGVDDASTAATYGLDVDQMREAVADHLFSCEVCGWWVSVDEMTGDDTCSDCSEDSE